MRRIAHITAFFCIVLPLLSSCRAISSFLTDDEVVAQVGISKLYRSELDRVVPKGLPPQDSSRLAMQYIHTWASDLVFLKIAEEQLSKSEKDVTRELEDYRKSLLKYRYEQLYVNERLDTAVSMVKVEEYYAAHQEQFILSRPVLKARFLCISSDSPALEPIRRRMSSDDANDIMEADSLAYSAAMKFETWSDRWIDAAVLSREFGMSHDAMISLRDRNGWIEHTDTTGHLYLAYVTGLMQTGEYAPVEYCAPTIKDMIISSRKQTLVSTLEQDLLNDARDNGQFVIF